MAELSADDVEAFTNGRISASNDETERLLKAALTAARSYVGWHVSPVAENQIMVVDGPGWSRHRLHLPTMKVVRLIEVVDAGVTLDLTTQVQVRTYPDFQPPYAGAELIRHQGHWSYKTGDIKVTLDHGFTETEAADWRQAILSMVVDMASISVSGRPDSDLASKQVDDVVYRWNPEPVSAHASLPAVQPILESYRLGL